MKPLTTNVVTEIHKQHNTSPWVWLYEIFLVQDEVATKPFRCTSYDADLTWNGFGWRPFPVVHESVRIDSTGNLQQLELRVSNVSRYLSRYVDQARGLADNDVRIVGLNRNALADADADQVIFRVISSAMSDQWVTLRLGQPAFLQRPMPDSSYMRNRCEHAYRDPDTCAYAGLLGSCSKTYTGPNGCLEHGADEVANGLPKMHPRRIGMEPAIPRRIS